MSLIETDRLAIRPLTADDAGFILELLNEPSFLRYVGDKGVRTEDDARRYIRDGPIDSYRRFGFGLCLVELKDEKAPIGICGLLKRDSLEDPDIGFAFLPRYWGKGYAVESAAAVLARAREDWGLERILAVTSPDNEASIRLLSKLGFRFERMARLSDEGEELKVFAGDTG